MTEPQIIVCAPADGPFVVAGSTFDHVCCTCSERVMMAPSGQEIIRQNPETTILCIGCFSKLQFDGQIQPATDFAQILREMASARPNPWRGRN